MTQGRIKHKGQAIRLVITDAGGGKSLELAYFYAYSGSGLTHILPWYGMQTMTRFFLTCLLLLSSFLVTDTTNAADQSALGKPYVQKPLRYRIDYKIDAAYVTLNVIAEPAITGCGSVTDLPLKASFDFEAADIVVGDYVFLQPMGNTTRTCSSSYKAASAKIAIDRQSIARKNVQRLRLWYQNNLDTFQLLPASNGGLELKPPTKTKMFFLGRDLGRLESGRN